MYFYGLGVLLAAGVFGLREGAPPIGLKTATEENMRIESWDWAGWAIEFHAEGEDIPIRGNAGDDAECEAWLIERLESGDGAAWFCARVTARCGDFHGVDYLGGCSYESYEQFPTADGYFVDMVRAAMLDALDAAESEARKGDDARVFLANFPRELSGDFAAKNA